ncbi:hypothetical protein ACIQUG_03480 [Ensifer sp. NPDC090286]
MRAGLAVATIERKCGFGRGKLAGLVGGITNTNLTVEERHRL